MSDDKKSENHNKDMEIEVLELGDFDEADEISSEDMDEDLDDLDISTFEDEDLLDIDDELLGEEKLDVDDTDFDSVFTDESSKKTGRTSKNPPVFGEEDDITEFVTRENSDRGSSSLGKVLATLVLLGGGATIAYYGYNSPAFQSIMASTLNQNKSTLAPTENGSISTNIVENKSDMLVQPPMPEVYNNNLSAESNSDLSTAVVSNLNTVEEMAIPEWDENEVVQLTPEADTPNSSLEIIAPVVQDEYTQPQVENTTNSIDLEPTPNVEPKVDEVAAKVTSEENKDFVEDNSAYIRDSIQSAPTDDEWLAMTVAERVEKQDLGYEMPSEIAIQIASLDNIEAPSASKKSNEASKPDDKGVFEDKPQLAIKKTANEVSTQKAAPKPTSNVEKSVSKVEEAVFYEAKSEVSTGDLQGGLKRVDPTKEPAQKFVVVRKSSETTGIESVLMAAKRAMRLERYDAALAFYDDLYLKNNRDLRILIGRAVALQKSGRQEAAAQAYEEVLKIDPNNTEVIVNMLGMIRENNPSTALAKLLDLKNKNPSNVGLLAQVGIAHADLGNYREALHSLEMASSLEPRNAKHLYNMGIIAEKMKDGERAIKYYEKALELDAIYGKGRMISREAIYKRLQKLRRM